MLLKIFFLRIIISHPLPQSAASIDNFQVKYKKDDLWDSHGKEIYVNLV